MSLQSYRSLMAHVILESSLTYAFMATVELEIYIINLYNSYNILYT
jgi:hypothetical protein